MGVFSGFLDWLRGLFFAHELEITIVGLQNSGKRTTYRESGADRLMLRPTGKTSLVNVLSVRVLPQTPYSVLRSVHWRC